MSWVTIDKEKCNGCGICVVRCFDCFSRQGDQISVNATLETCKICGHCISLCPTDAIRHEMMDINNFPLVDNTATFDTGQFINFIRQRRSHRHFRDQAIPREQLEILMDACRYAPTGSNRQSVAVKVIQNRDRIKHLSDITIDYFAAIIRHIEDQVDKIKKEGKELPKELESLRMNVARYRPLLRAREFGLDLIFKQAPCVLIFHASPLLATTPKDDCVIAAQTVSMLAMTMKLESCYMGLFTAAANAHLPIIEELALPPHHQVYSVLIMGYPKLKYLRAVDRKPIDVTWE
jgi:nitroreductase/Pyruvate/2-oxoacid:ferredoxin oxidoreductase delta subunit